MAYLGKTPSQGTRNRFYFTASGGETSLSGADDNGNTLTFADGAFVDVSVNGISLVAGTDYNTSTDNTIAGLTALSASDVVEIVAYDVFNIFSGSVNGPLNVSETVTASAFSGDGSALTGIPNPTLTSLGIANHNLLSVDSNGVLTLPDNYIVSGFEPTLPFDINSSGSNQSIDALYYNQWALGILTDFNIPTSETFKAPWSNTTILKGSLVEGNSADASRAASSLPSNNYGDTFILGNQDANNNLKSGLSISGHTTALISGADGESKLYKGTSQKLSTSSTGVSVTGDVSVTGGVYVGGTGSANYLDDFETGTFTPTVNGGVTLTIAQGRYTKVGLAVFVELFVRFPSTADGTFAIFTLPFTPDPTGSNYFFGGVSVVSSISTHVRNRAVTAGISPRTDTNGTFYNANFSGADVLIGGWYTTS
jgi:hypothetical protein